MARTDLPKTAPEVRPLGVTVLPSFETPAPPKAPAQPKATTAPKPAADQPEAAGDPIASPFIGVAAPAEPTPSMHPANHGHAHAHAETHGARSLLRRRSGRPTLVAVPDPQPTDSGAVIAVAAPVVVAPTLAQFTLEAAPGSAPVPPTAPDVTALEADLVRERARADSAEAANAVLRRRLAQLDDELAQFRPRAIVPFEDNTD